VVIVDEAHNARTPLTYDTFARLRPAALIELTATPIRQGAHRSNVLYHVSAEALKAEQMIKLPIVLHTHPNWEETVRDALLTRKRLAAEALGESEYLRPIVLFQADNVGGEVGVDRLKAHLIDSEKLHPDQIAVATGKQRGLDGVNLFDPACLIEAVITVEALKEGWDCSFAYVFCTLQKIGSSRDMEQLLGRVLRMPYARRRKSELLNRAYAHIASPETARVAGELTDRLVAMGFEELEAVQAVFPTTGTLFESQGAQAAVPPLVLTLPAAPDFRLLEAGATQGAVVAPRAEGGVTVTLSAAPDAALREALLATVAAKSDRERLERELSRFELRSQVFLAPSIRGVPFRPVPRLCLRDAQGELELAERTTLTDLGGFSLADAPAELQGFTPDADRRPYLVDIERGRLKVEQ
jgi:type III restriction enzyme